MEVINGFEKAPRFIEKTVVTIGNFDGVHLGHRKILRFVVNLARSRELSSLVLTFFPHPDRILGRGMFKLIQTIDQRLESVKKTGIRYVLVTPFSSEFSSLSSREFVENILVETLRAAEVVVGENFRFGKNRSGDLATLRTLASEHRLHVHEIPYVRINGKTVSSSLIRDLLQDGLIEEANRLLGRPYEIRGSVVKGCARGKTLGYPTANLKTENELLPLGVFLSEVVIGKSSYPSLTNIGYRPTFGPEKMQVESFLINFNQNLYGEEVKLRFLQKIRNEMQFTKPEELSSQLTRDLEAAKAYFKLS